MKRIMFIKHWQKLDNDEFTTIRLDRGTMYYRVGDTYKVLVREEGEGGAWRDHLCNAELIGRRNLKMSELTEEIAQNDIDPPNNTLADLKKDLYRFYENNRWTQELWKGEDTALLLLTFRKVGS